MTDPHEITLDVLAGSWRIYQLRRGHRFSADDLLTAWSAVQAGSSARSVLDLGAGIGSVGLLALSRLAPEARLTMVEVQRVSHELARKTVAHNRLESRVSLHNVDLRDWPGGDYQLVTASPPYTPPGNGTRSRHPQKAAARFELHGDVYDYCRAAARSLAADGAFCFCHLARDPRPEHAIAEAGLSLLQRREVYFRASDPPMIALFTCAHTGERAEAPALYLRDLRGNWTEEYLRIRTELGAPESFLARAASGS